MRRLQLLIVLALFSAVLIWVAFYRSRHTSSTAVAALLPKDTLAFIHLPDFNRSRTEFHQTDIYRLWAEPSLQEFLQRPRGKIPKDEELRSVLQQAETLQIKDAFIALLNIGYGAWKMVGGFRFKGDTENMQQIVAHWTGQLLDDPAESSHDTIVYQSHEIRTDTNGIIRIATVYADHWFLCANDPEQLKSLLDRLDGRVKDPNGSLAADESFVTATSRMMSNYMGLVFARVNSLVEKLIPDESSATAATNQLAAIRRIKSLCATTAFEGGKIRDKVFVEMPDVQNAGELTRASLPIATKDAFLYATGLLNLTGPIPLPGSHAGLGWISGLQTITGALSANGVTVESWNSAFGPELSWLGEWSAASHWPTIVAILPVKNVANADKILRVITTADDDSVTWAHRVKDGVQYFSARSAGQLFAFSPTIGLSDRILVVAADAGSVETTIKRNAIANSELATSKVFLKAENAVPAAKKGFAYIDPGLFYTRVDATLRPIILMSSAFLPGIVDTIDVNKLPAPEIITKHLSPIVISQNYDGRGYIAESVGPITFSEAIVTVGGLGALAGILYQKQIQR